MSGLRCKSTPEKDTPRKGEFFFFWNFVKGEVINWNVGWTY
jgi:hypothetical protein